MENVQDKFTFNQRLDLIFNGTKDGGTLQYFAEQIEIAYLAGYNRLDISKEPKILDDTGPAIVAARNYVKDKGYKK